MGSVDVIVLGGMGENAGDLIEEVQKVKASLLYGDKILVKSHKVPILLGRMAAIARVFSQQTLDAGILDKDMASKLIETLERRGLTDDPDDPNARFIFDTLRGDSPSDLLHLPEALAEVLRERNDFDDEAFFRSTARVSAENYLRRQDISNRAELLTAVDELVVLSESAFVDVDTAGSQEIARSDFDEIENAFAHSLQRAFETFGAGPHEHPLLAAGDGLSLRDAAESASLPAASLSRANRAELAASMLADIPSFPTASIDELLDIRSRVENHLNRFRAAVAELESELNASVMDDGFAAAIDDAKLRHVSPALEELHESLDDAGLGPSTARAVPAMATGVLGLGASLALSAPDLAGVMAVAAGGTTATAMEFIERRKQENERKQHHLFLLFDVERRLGK
jgi:hypothetical protein